jgi:hypothetical protein
MITGRTAMVAAMIAACASVPFACSSGDDSEPPATLVPISVVLVTVPQSTTTTLQPIDPDLVDDCVAYVKFGAFTQNAMLAAMWDAADQDDATLRMNCVELGRDDPGALQALADGWASVQQVLQSTSTTTSTTLAPPRVPRTTVAPVETDPPVVDTTPDTTPATPPPET